MKKQPFDIITIAGSAGSLPIFIDILNYIPDKFSVPLVLVIHRMKNVASELNKVLSPCRKIVEPEDKEHIHDGCIYLAPQNYHLLVEEDRTFSLDYSELVHYSRPSIDVSFFSMSEVYQKRVLAILLSGANEDGAAGLNKIVEAGGVGIAQAPDTAEYPVMPRSAITYNESVRVHTPKEIKKYINKVIV